MSRDDEDDTPSTVDPAEVDTRVVLEDGSLESRDAKTVVEASVPNPGHGSEDPTLLADADDRTQLAKPGSSDPDSGSGPPLAYDEESTDTSVLEDKTSPPPVTSSPRSTPSPSDPNRGLEPGMVLFGEYEIVNVLGVGGMGEVYRARHRRLDEFRAIKVMHADLSNKKGAAEFFYREAKALLAVRHPAVAHCHDLLSDDAGRVYLVMEMIEGIPLSKKMTEGPMSADDVATLGARVSHGLAAAHRRGVIHRDVSPDNIVLPNGRVQEAKLIDFGIAKILEEGEGTIVDGFKGKLSYASPEQLGFFGGKLDGRSDFYSLGLVLAAAALGRPMAMGATVMEAVDARRDFERLPDDVPMGLRSAIQPLLALDPKDRPQYVDRLFVVPGGVEGADASAFAPPTPVHSTEIGSSVEKSRAPIAAVAAMLLLLAAGGGYWWSTSDPAAHTGAGSDVGESAERVGEAEASATLAMPTNPAVAPTPDTPVAIEEPSAGERTPTATPEPVAVAPAKPAPKRLSASDRIKIIGLISNAKLALSENRLMSPPGDNAYDRYQRVLKLDPGNERAAEGLRVVAERYVNLAESAAGSGDPAQARDYLAKARKADPSNPGLAALEARLAP